MQLNKTAIALNILHHIICRPCRFFGFHVALAGKVQVVRQIFEIAETEGGYFQIAARRFNIDLGGACAFICFSSAISGGRP
jgi:hypothetical protein